MEDAAQQGLGNATCPPHRAVQLGQSPVKLLCLLGPHCNAGLLLICSHSVATRTPNCIWPHTTVEDQTAIVVL